ncbi:MAG: GNAT family N-acetyltransferase [Albidovulum sp.]
MKIPTFRRAEKSDATRLNVALRRLSDGMGDTHRASDDQIETAGFGPNPAFHAMLAEQGGVLIGVAVYSPLFSTTRGMAGVYVSDLWIDPERRGQQLGIRVLAAVHGDAAELWGAGFMRLAVYHTNAGAKAFYQRLGFIPSTGEVTMTLDRDGLMNLEKTL